MRYWPILLLGLLQLPTPAQGGAWLREKGTGFTSTTVNVTRNYDIAESTFMEYGVRDDLTLGSAFSPVPSACNRDLRRSSCAAP